MYKKLVYLEIGLAALAILGFVLRLQMIELGQFLTFTSCSLLALLYLIMAFTSLRTRPPKSSLIISWLVLINCAVAVQTLGMKLFLLPGTNSPFKMALYGFLGLVIVLLINLWIAESAEIFEYYRTLLIRSLIIIGFTFMFFITPYRRIINLYYKNQPDKVPELIQQLDPPPAKK